MYAIRSYYDEVPLPFVAPLPAQPFELLRRLDALRHHLHAEGVAETEDGARNLPVLPIRNNFV